MYQLSNTRLGGINLFLSNSRKRRSRSSLDHLIVGLTLLTKRRLVHSQPTVLAHNTTKEQDIGKRNSNLDSNSRSSSSSNVDVNANNDNCNTETVKVAVLGGGLAGLSSVFRLIQNHNHNFKNETSNKTNNFQKIQIDLYEHSPRLGGWVHTIGNSESLVMEQGPHSIRPGL